MAHAVPSAARVVGRGCARGKLVQVAPIKATLKAPGTKRLKLRYDGPGSNLAFNFNLRRYTLTTWQGITFGEAGGAVADAGRVAGASTRPLSGSTQALFVGYVGCMISPHPIRQGEMGCCDQDGLGRAETWTSVSPWQGVTFGEAGGADADAGRVVKIVLSIDMVEVVKIQFGQLSKCLTGDMPAELGGLSALKTLDLRHNRLKSVPAELGGLTALTSRQGLTLVHFLAQPEPFCHRRHPAYRPNSYQVEPESGRV